MKCIVTMPTKKERYTLICWRGIMREIMENLTFDENDENDEGSPLTLQQAIWFIRLNTVKLNELASNMYNAYNDEHDLESLRTAELDWFREFIDEEMRGLMYEARCNPHQFDQHNAQHDANDADDADDD